MSWLFSRALVAEYSAGTCSDGKPSAQLNVMPTQHKFWRNDKTMEPSDHSRFGLTCEVLTAKRGEELLTLFREASRVKTSAVQGTAQALTAPAPASGEKWQESSTRYDRNSSTWKTHRCLFDEDLPWSLVTLPEWGLMLDGLVCQQAPTVRHKPGKGSGLLPTLTASDGKGARNGTAKGRDLSSGMTMTDWLWVNVGRGRLHPESAEWMMLWPSGWTDLRPLAMDRFLEWRQQHSAP
jgi:hypothetical protein